MALLSFGEVFGYPVDIITPQTIKKIRKKRCPFRNAPCTKVSKIDPLGVCSLSDGRSLTVICPFRFLEDNFLFQHAAKLAFGEGTSIVVAREIRILRTIGGSGKIGKVDYLIAKEESYGRLVDFAAIEVQSVYISGQSIRPAFHHFLKTGQVEEGAKRRPDFRSSAQKRLMPQLSLKVPVFRRWGKKFFVAVDRTFFEALPEFRPANSLANSEITWIVYPFSCYDAGESCSMGEPEIIFSQWSEVANALREGIPPAPEEILAEIASRSDTFRFRI